MKDLTYSPQSNAYLASYACFPEKSKGRLVKEKLSSERSEFSRDRDRIIHSTAFRRLEYKTQVFLYNEGDHYRTRLTHSLEVSQLARSIGRILKLDEELCEATALAHDIGHSPFGHAGEYALEEAMENYGGFDHNAQTIRILTKLENKYHNFVGLNLTWESLEGLAKHNGPVKNPPRALKEFNDNWDLKLNTYPSLEAQTSAIADDIAYNSHDIEDGINAGLFTLEEISELPVIKTIIKNLKSKTRNLHSSILVNEVRSEFIKHMIKDVVETSQVSLKKNKIKTIDDVRDAGSLVINFSKEFTKELQVIRKFLSEKMYHHHKVQIMTRKAKRIVKELFDFYLENPGTLPSQWRKDYKNKKDIAINIADFIAGMTDRYAFTQYKKIFDVDYTNL